MMLSDYDPNPLQTALTLYAANDEDKLRAHFDAMTSIQKEMFESQLFVRRRSASTKTKSVPPSLDAVRGAGCNPVVSAT